MEAETDSNDTDRGECRDCSEEDKKEHWNEEVATNIRNYLQLGQYPPGSEGVRRSNFRNRAKDFVVQDDQLYYKNKKDGSLRLAIYFNDEQQRVFQVHAK